MTSAPRWNAWRCVASIDALTTIVCRFRQPQGGWDEAALRLLTTADVKRHTPPASEEYMMAIAVRGVALLALSRLLPPETPIGLVVELLDDRAHVRLDRDGLRVVAGAPQLSEGDDA